MENKIPEEPDAVVIGGGPVGLSAAISLKKNGIEDILLIERNPWLGGILPQCIHEGFGLVWFNEVLTGPEYAQRFIDELKDLKVNYLLNTTVLKMAPDKTLVISNREGIQVLKPKVVVLAMGCREKTPMAIGIAGTRPSGVYTAGTAQNLMNIGDCMIGKKVVIIGSGDVGLIMARRLTLEGVKVEAVVEIMPYPGGLQRNVVQCLDDYDIPLLLNHTVLKTLGKHRVEGVKIAKVDSNLEFQKGTERTIVCDTVIASVGLIPENELSKMAGIKLDPITGGPVVKSNLETSVSGIFACGNVLHVHDLVDYATIDGDMAGAFAAEYIKGKGRPPRHPLHLKPGRGVKYVVPHYCSTGPKERIYFRVTRPARNVELVLSDSNKIIKKVRKSRVDPSQMIMLRADLSKVEITEGRSEVMVDLREVEA